MRLTISIRDSTGKPEKGDFTMRVSSATSLSGKRDIKNWLLLDSDLSGTLNDYGVFNSDKSKETKLLLDALILTHEWKRFSWKRLLEAPENSKPRYDPEKGIMIQGTARNFQISSGSEKTMASLNFLEEAFEEKQVTDEKDRFSFGPYHFNGSVTAILQVVNGNKRSKDNPPKISIDLDPQWPPILEKPGYARLHKREKTIS